MVAQRPLKPLILVRVQAPQPRKATAPPRGKPHKKNFKKWFGDINF